MDDVGATFSEEPSSTNNDNDEIHNPPSSGALAELLGNAKTLVERLNLFISEQALEQKKTILMRFGLTAIVEIILSGVWIITKDYTMSALHITIRTSIEVSMIILLSTLVFVIGTLLTYSRIFDSRRRVERARIVTGVLQKLIFRSEAELERLSMRGEPVKASTEENITNLKLREELLLLNEQQVKYISEIARLREAIDEERQNETETSQTENKETNEKLINQMRDHMYDLQTQHALNMREIADLQNQLSERDASMRQVSLAEISTLTQRLFEMQNKRDYELHLLSKNLTAATEMNAERLDRLIEELRHQLRGGTK